MESGLLNTMLGRMWRLGNGSERSGMIGLRVFHTLSVLVSTRSLLNWHSVSQIGNRVGI